MTVKTNSVQATSGGFSLKIFSEYNHELSDPARPAYFFDYSIHITNHNPVSAQLVWRTWEIIDANGNKNHVSGQGIKGEKPLIKAGESYHYRSFCILSTEFGIMKGVYRMKDAHGNTFEIEIPTFRLLKPSAIH